MATHSTPPASLRALLVVLAALAARCSGGSVVGVDAGPDTGATDVATAETATDTGADVPVDAGVDAPVDTGPVCPPGQRLCDERCVDTQNDRAHCGACGMRCPVGQVCAMGRCALECATSQTMCGERCVDTASDRANCGACGTECCPGQVCVTGRCAFVCSAGFTVCSDGGADGGCGTNARCVDVATDREHCGACGMRCPAGHVCEAGACVPSCVAGLTRCGGSCRDLQTDRAHCGACGMACPMGQVCAMGRCVVECVAGQTMCAGRCVDTQTDRAHCGACGTTCRTGFACVAGRCTLECPAGQTPCSDACVVTATDVRHCGACGNACPARANAAASCAGGTCGFACNAGFADCNAMAADGCEVNTGTSTAHCGACGRACMAANGVASCSAGACGVAACNPGFADCDGAAGNGCETDVRASNAHCGACGRACTTGVCTDGMCVVPRLASCAALHAMFPALPSGVYEIDPDAGGPVAPFRVYCDMTTDGGGWTYGAIVNTTTSSATRTRLAGVTTFGTAAGPAPGTAYSVNLTGVRFSEIRIDNFTASRAVRRTTAAPVVWDATTYRGDTGFDAKRIALAGGIDFRVGYYGGAFCPDPTVNIPMCFTATGNPTGWVCDTDNGPVEGWVDASGGEVCGAGFFYCRVVWRDTTCTSYAGGPTAVYGFAVR